ncbi:MAG: hypothetical protein HN719_04025, partial [Alphaproteobacteria bacterium]|nr:hypothetical protein [Alphaproteobacteria bacterium]
APERYLAVLQLNNRAFAALLNVRKAFFDFFQFTNIRSPIAIVLGFDIIFNGVVGHIAPEREFGESLAFSRSRTGLKDGEKSTKGENKENFVFDFAHNVSGKKSQKERFSEKPHAL